MNLLEILVVHGVEHSCFRVSGLGLWVSGLRSSFQGLGLKVEVVYGLRFMVMDCGFRVQGLGFRIVGCEVHGLGCGVVG